jgi:cation:H+ antiporter
MNETVGTMSRSFGFFLLFLFVLYMAVLIFHAKQNPVKEETRDETSVGKNMLFLISGLIFIIAGGQVVVNSAKEIAGFFGMSETLIGLTIVAVGTSLPEFVTSVVASQKGETGIAVGNVVGSNIFNLLLILGASSTIHPIAVISASMYDMTLLIIVSTIVYLFCIKDRSISRREGIIMVLLYIADMAFAAIR